MNRNFAANRSFASWSLTLELYVVSYVVSMRSLCFLKISDVFQAIAPKVRSVAEIIVQRLVSADWLSVAYSE